MRKHEPGFCAQVRALRKAPGRSSGRGSGAAWARPAGRRRTAHPAGNVSKVPQVISPRQQILRILRYPVAGGCGPADGRSPCARATGSASQAGSAPHTATAAACGSTTTAPGAAGATRAATAAATHGSGAASAKAGCPATAGWRPHHVSAATAAACGSAPTAAGCGSAWSASRGAERA